MYWFGVDPRLDLEVLGDGRGGGSVVRESSSILYESASLKIDFFFFASAIAAMILDNCAIREYGIERCRTLDSSSWSFESEDTSWRSESQSMD